MKAFNSPIEQSPSYRRAAWGGNRLELRSGGQALVLYDRRTGWGWGELHGVDGEVVAVLDHLGELAVDGSPVPMRLEASSFVEQEADGGSSISFAVESVTLADALSGSSFDRWVGSPMAGPLLTGTATITADPTGGGFDLAWELESHFDVSVRYLRGAWVRVGATTFGADRDDAILPGIEWALDREWTSGDDWFRDPWAMRTHPPMASVAIPVMAISRAGVRVSLSWDPLAAATGWFSMERMHQQPVFASPNSVERNDSSLLGLGLPAGEPDREPFDLHRGQRIVLGAHLEVGAGSALDAVVETVVRRGLPAPPPPRWPLEETLHRIADAYSTNLWHDGLGFGVGQTPGDISARVPAFAEEYLRRFGESESGRRLAARIDSLAEIPHPASSDSPSTRWSEDVVADAENLLTHQHPDGSFVFDPDGRHQSKDDFVVARDLVAPMGLAGDTALDLVALPAITLIRAADATGHERFSRAALSALDVAADFRRPEGGDFWETPLHAPNLLAAGHGAVASALAWQRHGRETDRLSARRWLRSLLVFTHLWEPRGRPMLYNTKPCLCSSDWYFANWVRDHVQWEVLETFAIASRLSVDLAAVDEEIDWNRFHRGITWAAVRWLIDSADDTWRPHNLPASLDLYRSGAFEMCLPDTHNSTTGLYGGMAIAPDAVAVNLLALR